VPTEATSARGDNQGVQIDEVDKTDPPDEVCSDHHRGVPRLLRRSRRVDTTEAGHFVIKDANGFALAYVYARSDPALRDQYLSPVEALVIAEAIVKLSKIEDPPWH
jgi:hypothetical protein